MRLRRRGAGGERRQERRRLVPFQGGEFPGAAIGHEGAQELVVERMAGFVGHVAREQRVTGQVQVADGIQDLVPYEFVGESQAFGIEDAVFGANLRGALRDVEASIGDSVEILKIGRKTIDPTKAPMNLFKVAKLAAASA